jgi:AraC-like DNA-binding protein
LHDRELELSLFMVMNTLTPFECRPGFDGVAVSLNDKRWMLREWHSHETLEINLILRGSGMVLLEDRRYPLLPGHLVWLWPGQRHIPSEWSSDLLLWVVEWQPHGLSRWMKERKQDTPAPGDCETSFCRRLPPPVLQRLDGLFTSVAAMEQADTFNRGLEYALFALWDEFRAGAPVVDGGPFHPKLETVLRLLGDSHQSIPLSQLAGRVQLSPTYLSALFQKQTGLTIPAYRNRLRLQAFFAGVHAHPEIGLLTHALEAGFGSYAQFYRVFTDAMGLSPRDCFRTSASRTHKAARTP